MVAEAAAESKVDYQLVIYDELPAEGKRGPGGRSILNEQLDTIVANEEAWGRPVRIALYTVGSAATSAKATLERRFKGRAEWQFFTRPIPVDTTPGAAVRKGLFAVYVPGRVVDPDAT